ncbi:hypothetical protein C2W64_03295 [Brevibacillus laterosporus]|nr:hypothetical protein C2W64_03295 [Brevibacillus laterosporus]
MIYNAFSFQWQQVYGKVIKEFTQGNVTKMENEFIERSESFVARFKWALLLDDDNYFGHLYWH